MTEFVVAGCSLAILAVGNPWVVPRVQARWREWRRSRRGELVEWCEVCATKPKKIYVVTATYDDDEALGMAGGRSFMQAFYCRSHRPPDAVRRPNPRR